MMHTVFTMMIDACGRKTHYLRLSVTDRTRVTASGMARGCLFSREETDPKPLAMSRVGG